MEKNRCGIVQFQFTSRFVLEPLYEPHLRLQIVKDLICLNVEGIIIYHPFGTYWLA